VSWAFFLSFHHPTPSPTHRHPLCGIVVVVVWVHNHWHVVICGRRLVAVVIMWCTRAVTVHVSIVIETNQKKNLLDGRVFVCVRVVCVACVVQVNL
jgi:hypothetical protein